MSAISSVIPFITSVKAAIVVPPMASKITEITTRYFRLIQGTIFGSYGLKEFLLDGKSVAAPAAANSSSLVKRIGAASSRYFSGLKQDISSGEFHIIHGGLYFTSGLMGSIASFHDIGQINLGGALPFFNAAEIGSFLLACVIALHHNIEAYRKAALVPEDFSKASQDAEKEKLSALFGIASNLHYLFWCAMTVIGGSGALALFFACVGLAAGCIKIVYDIFR